MSPLVTASQMSLVLVLISACGVGTITGGISGEGQSGADGGKGDDALSPKQDGGSPVRYSSLRLVGRYEMPVAADVAVSADGNTVAITSWTEGYVNILDVSDKAAPSRIATIDNLGYSPDLQLSDSILYISHEETGLAPFNGDGVTIYDISTLDAPVRVGALDENSGAPGLENCHNTWPQPERELLYCASSKTGKVVILTTAGTGSRIGPKVITSISPPEGGMVHDMFARGERLYIAWLTGGFAIYDISDPSQPVELGSANYDNSFTHTVWPSDDQKTLYSTDENAAGHLRIWDIAQPATPQQIGEYNPNPSAIVHNAEVVDDYVFISHYTEGLKVLDASDPLHPVEIGSHDFFDGPDGESGNPMASMQGAWGVDAVPPFVFVSGMESGLWIYEMER